MKAFDYAAPRTESQVVDLLSPQAGHTEIIAGGTDLMGLMRSMVVRPDRVVNIMEVESLRELGPDDQGAIRIGAAVHLDELLSIPYLENYPALGQALRGMNSMQLQAQGTVGGDICVQPRCWFYRSGLSSLVDAQGVIEQGDHRNHAIFGNAGPAKFVSGSRLAPALIALEAEVRLLGPQPDEQRWIPLADLYRIPRLQGQRHTTLEAGQFVTHIRLPAVDLAQGGATSGAYEVRHGEGPDYPLAAAAVKLSFSGSTNGVATISDARVVLGQVAPTPWFSEEARRALIGRVVTPQIAEEAGEAAVLRATPLARNRAKVQHAKVAVKRAVLLAAGLETGGF